ncbi:MAG TPA: DUF3467 domain-containing protein [Thermoguttaceae bacterium]|nr:DUF3467 domain-containing protein [Thermoguttaceae bacterium]
MLLPKDASAERTLVLNTPETGSGAPPPNASDSAAENQNARQQSEVEVDVSEALTGYSNFCRVTGTPEELLIDFGLNPQPFGRPTHPIPINQRIVTNLYTAKRLLYVLQLAVQRHEATFGMLETDVQKRVRGT